MSEQIMYERDGLDLRQAVSYRFHRNGSDIGQQLDLEKRLMRYPCSYMVYSTAFGALPIDVRRAIYDRMWDVLSGRDTSPKYARLSEADRRALVEILRETLHDLPGDFSAPDRVK